MDASAQLPQESRERTWTEDSTVQSRPEYSGKRVEQDINSTVEELRRISGELAEEDAENSDHHEQIKQIPRQVDNLVRNLHMERRHEVLQSLSNSLEARLQKAKKDVCRLEIYERSHDVRMIELEEHAQETKTMATKQEKNGPDALRRFVATLEQVNAKLQRKRDEEKRLRESGGDDLGPDPSQMSDEELERAICDLQSRVAERESDAIMQLRTVNDTTEGVGEAARPAERLLVSSPHGQKHCSGVYNLTQDDDGKLLWQHESNDIWLFETAGRWCIASGEQKELILAADITDDIFDKCYIMSVKGVGAAPEDVQEVRNDAWGRMDEESGDYVPDADIRCLKYMDVVASQDELIVFLRATIKENDKRTSLFRQAMNLMKIGELGIKNGTLGTKVINDDVRRIIEELLVDIRLDVLPGLKEDRRFRMEQELKHADESYLEWIVRDKKSLEQRVETTQRSIRQLRIEGAAITTECVEATARGEHFKHPVLEAAMRCLTPEEDAPDSPKAPSGHGDKEWKSELEEAHYVVSQSMKVVTDLQSKMVEANTHSEQLASEIEQLQQRTQTMTRTNTLLQERAQTFELANNLLRGENPAPSAIGEPERGEHPGRPARPSLNPRAAHAPQVRLTPRSSLVGEALTAGAAPAAGKERPRAVRAALAATFGGGAAATAHVPFEAADVQALNDIFLGIGAEDLDPDALSAQSEVLEALATERKSLEARCEELEKVIEIKTRERLQATKQAEKEAKVEHRVSMGTRRSTAAGSRSAEVDAAIEAENALLMELEARRDETRSREQELDEELLKLQQVGCKELERAFPAEERQEAVARRKEMLDARRQNLAMALEALRAADAKKAADSPLARTGSQDDNSSAASDGGASLQFSPETLDILREVLAVQEECDQDLERLEFLGTQVEYLRKRRQEIRGRFAQPKTDSGRHLRQMMRQIMCSHRRKVYNTNRAMEKQMQGIRDVAKHLSDMT